MHQRSIQLSNPKKLVFKDCLIRKFQNKTETVPRKIKDWISGFSALLCSLFKTLTSWWPVLLPVWPLAFNWCLPTSVRHVKFDHFYSFWSRKLALQSTSSKETIKELQRATLFFVIWQKKPDVLFVYRKVAKFGQDGASERFWSIAFTRDLVVIFSAI